MRWQMARIQHFAIGDRDTAFDDILQFPHVAGEGIDLKALERLG